MQLAKKEVFCDLIYHRHKWHSRCTLVQMCTSKKEMARQPGCVLVQRGEAERGAARRSSMVFLVMVVEVSLDYL